MRVTYDDPQKMAAWASERMDMKFVEPFQAIGNVRDTGEYAAVVVYNTFSARDCFMHIASDGSRTWLTREFLCHAFAYPFIQCNLSRVTGIVAASNRAAMQFDTHLGFEYEGRCREAADDGGDIIVLGLLRRNCRYIPAQARQRK